MNAEYINLVERKKKLGTNIGALDFLLSIHKEKVDLQHKNSPLKGNDNLIHKRINEYDNVLELSKNVSAQNSGNEFSYLLGYADSLRKVGMLDTYIKIVCYLTIQSRYFKNGERVKLFEHISNALRYSRSDFLINLIFERYIEYINHLKLSPKQKDFYFCTKFSKFHD
ncbi:TPA: K5 polysaccharide biosynthesis glycosyltransferase KfiC, partial [Escherichia coli]|nr:glycosyltransferase family 2 protein [Escherichia coli]HAM7663136.1 glycosyltransferase family 2 protein [Escherichia coli]HAZ5587911.1 glycosyltransferase family 2 protein [Escherichia coli]HBB6271285.1 glycosyltransferase family 2 protein [Escherichia coli]